MATIREDVVKISFEVDSSPLDAITGDIQSFREKITGAVGEAGQNMQDISGLRAAASDFASGLGAVSFDGLFSGLQDLKAVDLSGIFDDLQGFSFGSLLEGGRQILQSLGEAVRGGIGGIFSAGQEAGQAAMDGVAAGAGAGMGALSGLGPGVQAALLPDQVALLAQAMAAGLKVPEGAGSGILLGLPSVTGSVNALSDSMVIEPMVPKEKSALAAQAVVQAAADALTSGAGIIQGQMAGLENSLLLNAPLAYTHNLASASLAGQGIADGLHLTIPLAEAAMSRFSASVAAAALSTSLALQTLSLGFDLFVMNTVMKMMELQTSVQTTAMAVQEIISSMSLQVSATVQSMCDQMVASVTALQPAMQAAGQNAMEGFHQGILSKRGAILATVQQIAAEVASTMNAALQIHSPSRVLFRSGADTGLGYQLGLASTIPGVRETVREVAFAAVPEVVQPVNPIALTPESHPVVVGGGTTIYNDNHPQFTMTIQNSGQGDREIEYKVKQWIIEGMNKVIASSERRAPLLREA